MFSIPDPPKMREMTTGEKDTAKEVFESTIIYSSVRIADDAGLGGKPWCSPPGWGWLPYFILHVGSDYDEIPKGLLIHELAHVWQGQHGIPFDYVINSGCSQAYSWVTTGNTGGAYEYSDNLQWFEYNVEQQAAIVQHWYRAGMSRWDWRYRYICSNILAGDPSASSQPVQAPLLTVLISNRRDFTWP